MSTLHSPAARAPHAVAPALPAAGTAQPATRTTPRGVRLLDAALKSWLAVALVGQLMFAAYVLGLYGRAAVHGQWELWNRVTPRGHVPGDALGNLVFGAHLLFTVVVIVGGFVQLLPALRRHAPAVHRWNGRVFMLAAVALALGGTTMLLTRGTVGGVWQQAGTAMNGVVIVICAALAWRHARSRRMAEHRRWALRLFLAVAGVWLFRVGLMAWLLVHRAPVGFDAKTFSGPFLTFLAFAQFLLPLAVLELVFRAQAAAPGTGAGLRTATATLVFALTGLTALGVVGATLVMWWPRM